MSLVVDTEIWKNKKSGKQVKILNLHIFSIYDYNKTVIFQEICRKKENHCWESMKARDFIEKYQKM